jgi:acyl-CoA thioester hydrolase
MMGMMLMLDVHDPKNFDYFTRVYYEDTDVAGVVYHSNYLKFMERARSEWLLFLDDNRNIMHEQNAFFTVVHVQLDFIRPARLYDELQVVTKIIDMTYASMVLEQIVKSAADTDLIFCQGTVKLACVNRAMKPRGIPKLLRRRIEHGD